MAPKNKIELKTPKGTKDWFGNDMVIREGIFSLMRDVFKKHGALELDTPMFELKEILTNKYGEDSKLIYDLKDQGGELSSLRYDLTVPFSRWLAMTGTSSVKRFAIGKVFRRDQPAMTKGRLREFYQCDFDVAGVEGMLVDAEVVKIVDEVFTGLGWTNFTIKLNHRKILDGIFQVCGVPDDKIRTISSAVDKLDKLPWADVKKEMTGEKGLPEDVADRIGEWVVLKGQRDLLDKLRADEKIMANETMKQGIADFDDLFTYLEAFGVLERVSFDLSLARGLDYYTGLIYECVSAESAPSTTPGPEDATVDPKKKAKKDKKGEDEDRSDDPSVGVGSVAAGGRYDNLVGGFSGKKQVPCVGISFGVERIFAVTKARNAAEKVPEPSTVDAYVMAIGSKTGLVKERLALCTKLWDAGIRAEFLYKTKPKLPQQFKAAESSAAPFAVIIGDEEAEKGVVRIKELGLPEGHPLKDGELVESAQLASEVQKRLARRNELEELSRGAEGLKVVGGLRGEDVKSTEGEAQAPRAAETPAEAPAATEGAPATEDKPSS